MHITRRQTNTLASERDSIIHHLGTLQSQESQARHPPAPPPRFRLAVPPDEEELACNFCTSNQHLTTEYPHAPDLVYDQAEPPPRTRRPGERVNTPASWPSLHQATLHYLVTNVIQYFWVVHNSPTQRRDLLQLITHLLDLPPTEHKRTDTDHSFSGPTELGHDPTQNLFTRAVNELVTHLRASPFSISNNTDPLLHTLCERYYSPVFGRMIDEYCVEVYSRYSTST
jgi:hypothetical protein